MFGYFVVWLFCCLVVWLFCCLSVRQYHIVVLLRLRLSPHALKRFTDNADATDFYLFTDLILCCYLVLDLFRIIIAPDGAG